MTIPKRFKEHMEELLGPEFAEFEASYIEMPGQGLRINTEKTNKEEFEMITPFSCVQIPWIENGYFYQAEEQPSKHPYYYAGLYYLQEPSAMTPASLLDIKPGDLILDTCAAPGGKTTELAAKTKGKGVLFANDISSTRAKALRKNIELFGYKNTVITSENTEMLLQSFPETFDKILVDAPCSGEGMFRKDPSLMKSWEERGPAYYSEIQKQIILDAADMLKPGGMMLYSTCTFSPEENEAVVRHLLKQREGFEIIRPRWYEGFSEGRPEWIHDGAEELKNTVRIWPHKMSGEGHYAALLRKQGTAPVKKTGKIKNRGYQVPEEVRQFMQMLTVQFDAEQMKLIGEKLLLLPGHMPDISGLRILRSGLYLGDIRRNRFEPSQALAMSLKKEECSSTISIPAGDERVIRYLKGETIDLTGLTVTGKKGWHLICIGDYPLGWGKVTGATLKNKYYAGWRWL